MPFATMSFMIIIIFTTNMEDISNDQDLIFKGVSKLFCTYLLPRFLLENTPKINNNKINK